MYSGLGGEVTAPEVGSAPCTEAKLTTALAYDAQPWKAGEVADVNFLS